jgi:hypothetical protein
MTYRPMKLQGDLLAFSDDWAETILWNWKNDTWASLQHTADSDSTFHVSLVFQKPERTHMPKPKARSNHPGSIHAREHPRGPRTIHTPLSFPHSPAS